MLLAIFGKILIQGIDSLRYHTLKRTGSEIRQVLK